MTFRRWIFLFSVWCALLAGWGLKPTVTWTERYKRVGASGAIGSWYVEDQRSDGWHVVTIMVLPIGEVMQIGFQVATKR